MGLLPALYRPNPLLYSKSCPSCSIAMLYIFNLCMTSLSFPQGRQVAFIKLISKSTAKSDPSKPSHFRPIALTSSIGKIFTAILKDRLLGYASENSFLDTHIQKAFVDYNPGYLENLLYKARDDTGCTMPAKESSSVLD